MHSANAILARTQFESGPKIVNSFLSEIYFTRCSLHQLLLERLQSDRSAPQKIFDQQTLQSFTYSELAQLIRKTATAFSEQFLLPGDYVIYIGPNCLEYLSLYFGALCVGAIPISIPKANVSLQDIKTKIIQHNIQYLVISAEVDSIWLKKLLNSVSTITKVIIYNQETRNPFHKRTEKEDDEFHSLLKNLKVVTYFDFIQNANIAPMTDDDLYRPKNVATSLCLAVDSSGNGEWPPKILLYSHYALVAAVEVLCHSSVLDYRSIDRLLAYGPFEHLENVLMFLSGIFLSCNIILLPSFNLDCITESIQNHRINLAWLSANTVLKLIKVQPKDQTKPSLLGALTKVVSFGGKISTANCTEFFLRFPRVKSLRHCYLLSESPIPISMMVRNSQDYDSVGYVMPNTRIKVLQDPTNGDSMNEPNKPGFICVEREPELFALGYLNQYSQHLVPLPFETPDGETASVVNQIVVKPANSTLPNRRWYRTDDIGYYDEDGLLYVYGKWFNTLGPITGIRARIQENEIESILLSHPAVEEVALILKRDQTWAAAVVAKEFSTTKLPKLTEELGAHLHSKLNAIVLLNQPQAKVSNIFIKHSLPKTSSGRVVRCLIRDEVQNLLNIKRKF